MDSQISNLRIYKGTPEVVQILERYFPEGHISIGSLLRKLPFVLMDFVEMTGNHWRFQITISKENPDFGLWFKEAPYNASANYEPMCIQVIHVAKTDDAWRHAINLLRRSFAKDRWVKFPVSEATVMLYKETASFCYGKSMETYRESGEAVGDFSMELCGRSLWQRIRKFFSKKTSWPVVKFHVIHTGVGFVKGDYS